MAVVENIYRQIVGPVEPHDFMAADYEMLYAFELRKRTSPVLEALISAMPSLLSSDRYETHYHHHLGKEKPDFLRSCTEEHTAT